MTKVSYITQGKERKNLALTIAKWLGCEVEYKGAPTFAYKIDSLILDKDSTLIIDDSKNAETINRLLEHLHDEGFEFDDIINEVEDSTSEGLSLSTEGLTETTIQNIKDLIFSKQELIKHAFGVEHTMVVEIDNALLFPWFKRKLTLEEHRVYSNFLLAICETAKKLTRVNKTDRIVENEKYAFRCFLLKLGYVGDEHKTERKLLLSNLEGSSAFKTVKEA